MVVAALVDHEHQVRLVTDLALALDLPKLAPGKEPAIDRESHRRHMGTALGAAASDGAYGEIPDPLAAASVVIRPERARHPA